MNIDSIN